MIIGLAGKARSGKDTTGLHLHDVYGATLLSFAQPIKDMLEAMGIEAHYIYGDGKDQTHPEYGITPRRMMQTLGTEWGRALDPMLWINVLLSRYQHIKTQSLDPLVVVTDVRFTDEVDAIRAAGGVVINIDRPGLNSDDDHASEAGISDFDFTIKNNGSIDQLWLKIDDVMREVCNGRYSR